MLCSNSRHVGHLKAIVNKAVVDVHQTSVLIEQNRDLKESLDKFFKLDAEC